MHEYQAEHIYSRLNIKSEWEFMRTKSCIFEFSLKWSRLVEILFWIKLAHRLFKNWMMLTSKAKNWLDFTWKARWNQLFSENCNDNHNQGTNENKFTWLNLLNIRDYAAFQPTSNPPETYCVKLLPAFPKTFCLNEQIYFVENVYFTTDEKRLCWRKAIKTSFIMKTA